MTSAVGTKKFMNGIEVSRMLPHAELVRYSCYTRIEWKRSAPVSLRIMGQEGNMVRSTDLDVVEARYHEQLAAAV